LAIRCLGIVAVILAATATQSAAQETILLYAAGSLRGALNEVAKSFEATTGVRIEAKYGPSGLLRDEIAGGAKADVFASANMSHPESLAKAYKSGPVSRFARNTLCALVKPGLAATPDTLLERMLDPDVKLGTSTPKADPSGDYALESFAKADKLKPGARDTLEKKALQLTGGPNSPPPPKDRSVYGTVVADAKADIFLTYCTNAIIARHENPGQQVVALPPPLAVGADYGLTVIGGASANADKFVAYILGAEGQKILAKHGFAPPK
jgi:ABC-type molybdate transport system substrate-binding protein